MCLGLIQDCHLLQWLLSMVIVMRRETKDRLRDTKNNIRDTDKCVRDNVEKL